MPPSANEQREKLEQLRALDAGMRIDVTMVKSVPLGVDTPGGFGKGAQIARWLTQTLKVCVREPRRSRHQTIRKSGGTWPRRKSSFRENRGQIRILPAAKPIRTTSRCPAPTFEDCFAALVAGDVDLGMIPIENSVAGRVADIHHLMPTAGLHIIAEWFLPIRNQLMAPKGASLKTIRTVQSHVMALGQCRNIIRELKLKPVVAADTAGSAREVAEAKDATRAAIASRLAAEIYGLDILKENVEDEVAFDHALRRAVAREEMGASQARARSSRPSCSGCATCRLRSTRRSAASLPTAST